MFDKMQIDEFIKKLASKDAAPGGGTVAALTASLAAGLNSMVYSLTIGKKSYEALEEETKEKILSLEKESKEFTNYILGYMEKDREVFLALMDCYKLPKENEEEKAIRNAAIQEKTVGAMMVPLELARKCEKFYENIDVAVKYGNKEAISDAGCAAILLDATIKMAILNVKINLAYLNTYNDKTNIEKEIEDIIKSSEIKSKELQKRTEAIING